MVGLDSQKLKQFLLDHVETLEELQILVWFHRHSGASATDTQIAEETAISLTLVSEALERMANSRILSSTDSQPVAFRYDPADAVVHETLQEVLARYLEDPRAVMQVMTANAIERLRASAMRAFAEAFRIRTN